MRLTHLLLLCCVAAFGYFMWGIGPSETYFATMATWERVKSEVVYLRSPPILHAKPGADPKAFVVFTFDDGHESVSRWAVPLLEAQGMRSTQFIIGDTLNDDPWFYVPGYRYHMPLPAVSTLKRHGHEIGSHTWTHLKLLGERDRDAVQHEIHDSRSRIAEKLGIPISEITSFAAPQGAYGPDEVVEIEKAYRYAVTAWGDRPNYDELNHYVIYRYNVGSNNRSTDVCEFIDKATNLSKGTASKPTLAVLALHYLVEGKEEPVSKEEKPDTYTIPVDMFKKIVECVRQKRDAGDLWVGTLAEAVHAYEDALGQQVALKGEN